MTRMMIVKWKIREPETMRILSMLPELVDKSRQEEGNVSYNIYQSETDPGELVLHEEYASAPAAESHKQSEHYQRIVLDQIVPHLASREVTLVKHPY